MTSTSQIVGNVLCQWKDSAPLKWTMSETTGRGKSKRTETLSFDLTSVERGFSAGLLLALKEVLLLRRHHIALITIHGEYSHLRTLLRKAQEASLYSRQVEVIDATFLAALQTLGDSLSAPVLGTLKRVFKSNRSSPVFDPRLTPEDFPIESSKIGPHGKLTANILVKALSRAACVEVLRAAEDAYEGGSLGIEHFSLLHLAFHVFCRPKSYRLLTLSDLVTDTDPTSGVRSYFLWITPAKTLNRPGF